MTKKNKLETSKSKIFFWLASLARLLLTNLNYIYCLHVMLELIYFQTGSPLVMVIVWYIAYSPFSQLEWPIIMTKQLLIICEWCSHRLIRSIRVLSWLENLKRAFSWLWSCLVVPLAVRVQLSRKPKLSLNLWQKPELSLNLLWKPELSISLSRKPLLAWSCRENLYIYSFRLWKK